MSFFFLLIQSVIEDGADMSESPSAHSWAVKKAFDVEVYDGYKRA